MKLVDYLDARWFRGGIKTNTIKESPDLAVLMMMGWPMFMPVAMVMLVSDRITQGKTPPSPIVLKEKEQIRVANIKSKTVKLQEEDPDYLAALEEIEAELNNSRFDDNESSK